MARLTARELLGVWTRGRDRHPIDRGLMLFALATPWADPEGLADEPLGRRNGALLELRVENFGPWLTATCRCAACRETLEIELDLRELLDQRVPSVPDEVEVAGVRFRPPTSRDLVRLVRGRSDDPSDADPDPAGTLLSLCRRTSAPDGGDAPSHAPTLEAVEAALGAADPWSDLSLWVECHACGHAWSEALDAPALLWDEVQGRARRLFDEVHLLASAYGWSEEAILDLPEARRAAYLERVTA